ncbi:MAG: cytochrome c, partial [Azonexus sp.]|nr:cytochrome c [Azonexus sp.]
GADTNYPPTKATPEVWVQTEKFEQLHQAFLQATDELAVAAREGKKAAVEGPYQRVHDTCHDCHQTFKKR